MKSRSGWDRRRTVEASGTGLVGYTGALLLHRAAGRGGLLALGRRSRILSVWGRPSWRSLWLLTLALTTLGLTAATGPAHADSSTQNFLVTLYGWPDNSPPGNAIAYPANEGYPTIHDAASGTGTYADPITFATDQDELPVGTIVYYPYLHRYFIMEDDCTECDEDWSGQGPDGGPNLYHIDLWINGEGAQSSDDVINCEDDLTQNSEEVIVNPPSDEAVDTTPLFDSSSDTCYDPSSFSG